MQEYIEEFNKMGFDGACIMDELETGGVISTQGKEETDKPVFMDFLVVSVDKYDYSAKAASVSAKNVIYNLDKLINRLPGLVMMGVFGEGVSESKVFQIIIQVLVMVPSLFTVKISEKEADCFYAIWKSLNGTREISEEDGLLYINDFMTKQGRPLIGISEYNSIIRQLEKYGFIELKEGSIVIKEMVLCNRW